MTEQQHPITPPPELVREWCACGNEDENYDQFCSRIATQAARWGADQELEACCEWLTEQCLHLDGSYLRADRRPKPPSLKEQALEALDRMDQFPTAEDQHTIRRALEAMPDD